MKVRLKDKPHIKGSTNKFNVHGLGEVLVGFTNEDIDSCFIKDLEAYIEKLNTWKDMNQAFCDKDIITDNFNTWIFEPQTEEDRERGYTL